MADREGGVLAVVVVYGRGLQQVEAWPALTAALQEPLEHDAGLNLQRVLVFDNSPTNRTAEAATVDRCEQKHDPGNGGTAAAYAHAASVARQHRLPWLLLLDHDTRLPADFLRRAQTALAESGRPVASAVLPWIYHGDQVISPARIDGMGSIRPLSRGTPVPAGAMLTGISSGSLIRLDAWLAIAPPPTALWLDYVDHWIFTRLQRIGSTIAISQASLTHDLSVSSPRTLSLDRLRNILEGEAAWVAELSWPARFAYPLRLCARSVKYAAYRDRRSLVIAAAAFRACVSLVPR
jgi:GT2 family glycosyltransferase